MMFRSAKGIKIKLLAWFLKSTSLNHNKTSDKRKVFQKSLEKYLDMLITAIKKYQHWNVTSIQISKSKWSSFEKVSPQRIMVSNCYKVEEISTQLPSLPIPNLSYTRPLSIAFHSFVCSLLNKHVWSTYHIQASSYAILVINKSQFMSPGSHREMYSSLKMVRVMLNFMCELDWAMGIWWDILGVSVSVFLSETNIWIRRLSKASCPLQWEWAPSICQGDTCLLPSYSRFGLEIYTIGSPSLSATDLRTSQPP